jgi:hypothetical protein
MGSSLKELITPLDVLLFILCSIVLIRLGSSSCHRVSGLCRENRQALTYNFVEASLRDRNRRCFRKASRDKEFAAGGGWPREESDQRAQEGGAVSFRASHDDAEDSESYPESHVGDDEGTQASTTAGAGSGSACLGLSS